MKQVYECHPVSMHRGIKSFIATGEMRPPREGEWYLGSDGLAIYATFDFNCNFIILKPKSLYRRCLNWFKTLKG